MGKTLWFNKSHPDCEGIDKIEFDVVERWKSSGMSGDEWRFSHRVRAYYKGVVVLEYFRNRMRDAVAHLPFEIDRMRDDGASAEFQRKRETSCDQPGCAKEPTRWYRLKEEFASRGEGPLPACHGIENYRKFCEQHKRRGDCAREDSDANYEDISKP